MHEHDLLPLAPSADVFDAAVGLVNRGALSQLGRTEAADQLFGQVAGSGANPYRVSAALGGDRPITRCTCPSRKFPCKHGLALLIAFSRDAQRFPVTEAPADAIKPKAQKADAAEEKPKPRPKRAKAPNAAAQAKKAQAQLEGLAAAERVLTDLAATGLSALDGKRLAALAARAQEIADFHLPGLALALRRFARAVEHSDPETLVPLGARNLAKLWAMVQKGRALLSEKLEEPQGAQDESDVILDELLGKIWQLQELKERGFVRPARLVELAYERVDDADRQERVETSYLLDVADGAIHRDLALIPARRVKQQAPKPSYPGVLEISECVLYPGFSNRRVRWEAEAAKEIPPTAADAEAIAARAVPLADAISRFQAQLKNMLAPDDGVALVGVTRAGTVNGKAVLEDAAGMRIRIAETAAAAQAFGVLQLLGWPKSARAMLVRLALEPKSQQVVAEPMSLITGAGVIRLST